MFAIERVQLNQTRVSELVEPVGIGKQFNPAHTLPNERFEHFGIAGPKESTDRVQMLGSKLCLFWGMNRDRYIAIKPEDEMCRPRPRRAFTLWRI